MLNLVNSLCFSSWANQFVKESSDRGIFARWLLDNEFIGKNRIISTKLPIKAQMIKNNCSEFLIQVFDECWDKFELIPNAIIQPKNRLAIKESVPRY